MGLIISTTTERGGGSIIYDGFSYRVNRARPGDKVIDWRCTNTKQGATDNTRTQMFVYYTANGR